MTHSDHSDNPGSAEVRSTPAEGVRIVGDRYARHIQLPEFGASGQSAVMQASVTIAWISTDSRAPLIAAAYLAASGVGTLVVPNANAAQLRDLAAYGPDTVVARDGDGRDLVCDRRPDWWPGGPGDDEALAFYVGGIAAAQWLAETVR